MSMFSINFGRIVCYPIAAYILSDILNYDMLWILATIILLNTDLKFTWSKS